MSISPFLSHISNTIAPFTCNPTKNPTQFPIFSPSKVSFITFLKPTVNTLNCTKTESRTIECESQDLGTNSSEPTSSSGSANKVLTAPWMNEPLTVKPHEILKFSKPKSRKDSTFSRNEENPDRDLTGKVGGGRGKVAMKKIFKSINKLQETQGLEEIRKAPEKNVKFRFSPGDLWENEDIGNGVRVKENSVVQECLGSDEFDIPLTGVERGEKVKKMPWESDERVAIMRVKKERKVMAAETSLDRTLLERLRGEAAMMRKWVKVMKAGVTQAVVDEIRFIWRNSELALIKFDLPLCRNMERAREIIEVKTGGIVVWSNKDFLAVYRGCNYLAGSKYIRKIYRKSSSDPERSSSDMYEQKATPISSGESSSDELHGKDDKWESLNMPSLYEREADRLLDGLGPRYVDWWMAKPLPVDADLLPEIVPGLKTPFRLCLPSTRSKLTDAELTYLRKLARPLPTHFVLGRNRKLQGLAAAILKLWEKCHIAKIAVKWGIPNTDNEQMANELKSLTGGVLLLRNKFFIILYRGKDFLPSEVAHLVAEREMELTRFHVEEEAARVKASEIFSATYEHLPGSGVVGTLSEFDGIQSVGTDLRKGKSEVELQLEAEQERLEKELKDQERKLFILKKKIEKSAKILQKLNHTSRLSERDADQEIISQEERRCLRQMGLKMDSSLVLGRRGIYDGVIEGMHQHWKHREIVKVITMQRKFSQVMYTANCLESESGGVLISIDKLKEGHAIIVFRGKNYKRPNSISQNLLSKREALSRSLEIQRLGSLKFFANQREQKIYELKRKLAEFSEKMDLIA